VPLPAAEAAPLAAAASATSVVSKSSRFNERLRAEASKMDSADEPVALASTEAAAEEAAEEEAAEEEAAEDLALLAPFYERLRVEASRMDRGAAAAAAREQAEAEAEEAVAEAVWLGAGHAAGGRCGGAPLPSREAWVRLSREAWAEAPPAPPQYDPAEYADGDGDAADHAAGYQQYATDHAADQRGTSSTYDEDEDEDDDGAEEETGYLAALHELRERAKAAGSMHTVVS